MAVSITKLYKDKNVTQKLHETLELVSESIDKHFGIIFYFSKLHKQHQNDFKRKICTNIINDVFRYSSNYVFLFDNYDIVVIFQAGRFEADSHKLINKVIFQLRYLLMQDPLAYISKKEANPEFCDYFALSGDESESKQKFQSICEKIVEENSSFIAVHEKEQEENKPIPFSDKHLTHITSNITDKLILDSITLQPIVLIEGQKYTSIFNELFVSMASISNLVTDEKVNVPSNFGLFKYVTEIIDHHVLNVLSDKKFDKFTGRSISLNLNCNTILNDSFTKFSDSISPDFRKTILIELHVADIFSNINVFMQARDKVKKLGYRTCIDAILTTSMPCVVRKYLACDFVKVQWNADFVSSLDDPENALLLESVKQCDPQRIILCRCDSEHAIEYGEALGISLYQGWHIDGLLSGSTKRYKTDADSDEEVSDSNSE